MIFRRTTEGISNLHIFVGVDLVVFTEGGPRTISKDDALSGDFETSSLDISFWRQVFHQTRSDLSVEFRALGSKNTLREIAIEIKDGNIRQTCVAMDRDYDGHLSSLLNSPNILYTRGYSWENDICNSHIIESLFFKLSNVDPNNLHVRREIDSIIRFVNSELRWFTYADALLNLSGASLFDRKNPESSIYTQGQLPRIRRKWLIQEFRKKTSRNWKI